MTIQKTVSKRAPAAYQAELDGLRFFAFLAVFIHHKSNPVSVLPHLPPGVLLRSLFLMGHVAGAYGVNLFFVLSSYLITRLLRTEIDSRGSLDVPAFYVRRALRIWPLYFFFLALCLVLSRFVTATPPLHGEFFVASLFFVNNWWMYLHGLVWLPLLPLWTISIEEQFYVTWPLLLMRAQARGIAIVSVAAIAISHVAAYWLLSRHPVNDYQITYNTLTQIQFFGLGALLALWAEGRTLKLATLSRLGILAAGVVLLALSAGFDLRAQVFSAGGFSYNVLYVLNALGVVAIFRSFAGAPAEWFPEWLRYLGKISFGLYVFNDFAGWVTRSGRGNLSMGAELILTLALNLALAIASYHLLEKPFLRLKRRFQKVESRPKAEIAESVAEMANAG